MAYARLQLADRFPAGTKVEVFPAALVGEPAGRHLDKRAPVGLDPVATVKSDGDGVLALDGLPPGRYVATADVDGDRRYVAFSAK